MKGMMQPGIKYTISNFHTKHAFDSSMIPSPSSLMYNHFKFSAFFLEMPFNTDPCMPSYFHARPTGLVSYPSLHRLPRLGSLLDPVLPLLLIALLHLPSCKTNINKSFGLHCLQKNMSTRAVQKSIH